MVEEILENLRLQGNEYLDILNYTRIKEKSMNLNMSKIAKTSVL